MRRQAGSGIGAFRRLSFERYDTAEISSPAPHQYYGGRGMGRQGTRNLQRLCGQCSRGLNERHPHLSPCDHLLNSLRADIRTVLWAGLWAGSGRRNGQRLCRQRSRGLANKRRAHRTVGRRERRGRGRTGIPDQQFPAPVRRRCLAAVQHRRRHPHAGVNAPSLLGGWGAPCVGACGSPLPEWRAGLWTFPVLGCAVVIEMLTTSSSWWSTTRVLLVQGAGTCTPWLSRWISVC